MREGGPEERTTLRAMFKQQYFCLSIQQCQMGAAVLGEGAGQAKIAAGDGWVPLRQAPSGRLRWSAPDGGQEGPFLFSLPMRRCSKPCSQPYIPALPTPWRPPTSTHVAGDAPPAPHLAPAGWERVGRSCEHMLRRLRIRLPCACCQPPCSTPAAPCPLRQPPAAHPGPEAPPSPPSPLGVPAVAAGAQRRRRVDVGGHAGPPRVVHRHQRHLAHQVVVAAPQVAARGAQGAAKRGAASAGAGGERQVHRPVWQVWQRATGQPISRCASQATE